MPVNSDQINQSLGDDERRRLRRRRLRIIALSLATALLFGLLFVQYAFNTLNWLKPSSVSETLSLYVLSTINFLAFIVLLMVLVRNIIKLRRERSQGKLGAHFKTRLVVFFIALSLLPVIFLFFATTGLINRSIDKWFSLPGDEMLTNALYIQSSYVRGEKEGLNRLATSLARVVTNTSIDHLSTVLAAEIDTQHLILARLYERDGGIIASQTSIEPAKLGDQFSATVEKARAGAAQDESFDAEVVNDETKMIYLIASSPVPQYPGRAFVIAQEVPQDFAESVNKIRSLESKYEFLKTRRKWLRNSMLQTLALITLLVLFIAFWLGNHVARTIADPVRQMAEATERIKQGDLSYRTGVVGDDELAALAQSFNEMTSELQSSNAALDERRRYIEAILQSLSAGVISLDEHSNMTTINDAALKLLHLEEAPAKGVALEALLPEEEREELRRMILRAARLRSVTREVHFTLANQAKLDASVTVTSLQDPGGQSRGAVIVFEDLTELIEAQRRAAWSEVARRMAHEIKNPLTPIRLSAERLAKNLIAEPAHGNSSPNGLTDRQTNLVRECTTMIGAEVATLQRMVDEFSNFARLPKANLEPESLNEVVETALKLYDERLNGLKLEQRLATELSFVLIDREQIKRVLVNLIDNAAEALGEVTGERRITVSTREVAERETVELIVADTGPGIAPRERERIFDPYFSTRKRGTGLGLAIVNRIIAEHQGRIRVQANTPRGARMIIELPTTKTIDN